MMTPCLQKPIKLGADLIVHSATKFISGHADVMAGVVVATNQELAEQVPNQLRSMYNKCHHAVAV